MPKENQDKPVSIRISNPETWDKFVQDAKNKEIKVGENLELVLSNYFDGDKNIDSPEDKAEIEKITKLCDEYQQANVSLSLKNDSLNSEKLALYKEIEILQAENEQLRSNKTEVNENSVTIEFDNFEKAVLDLSCAKETDRIQTTVTPDVLLKTMFINYVVKGEMFLFRTPSWNQIKNLKEKFKQ